MRERHHKLKKINSKKGIKKIEKNRNSNLAKVSKAQIPRILMLLY